MTTYCIEYLLAYTCLDEKSAIRTNPDRIIGFSEGSLHKPKAGLEHYIDKRLMQYNQNTQHSLYEKEQLINLYQ